MKKRTITSFEDYFRYTEKYKGQFYFRGQADTAWPICPSLFRSSSEITLDTERDVIRTYREKIPKITPLQALFLAQHYGSSTRICDLTISPLCALFFASEGVKDGVVYVIKKSQAIKENHPEMQLFVDILIGNSAEIREKYGDGITNLTDVLTRNYIVEYRDWGYSNPRAYRQGGTGIVFGFGYESNKLSPIGTASVDEMTEEKIVIPRNIKSIIMQHLSKFGYAKPILYSMPFEPLDIEVANLTQTECFVEKHADSSEIFYKISAKFRINTLFFDRDALAAQITDLHNAFFKKYGNNARIWTLFYYDETDINSSNWICKGCWSRDCQYELRWTDNYHGNRLKRLNEEISQAESLQRVEAIFRDISPFFDDFYRCVIDEKLEVLKLFECISSIRPYVMKAWKLANDIPFTDVETEGTVEKCLSFINNFEWLVSDMLIFSKRVDMNEKTIKWMLEKTYLYKCMESKKAYLLAKGFTTL